MSPFVWQSILIPILPAHLTSLLEAPLPFIIGLPQLDPKMKLPSDVIVVNLDSGRSEITASDTSFPQLPRKQELYLFIS